MTKTYFQKRLQEYGIKQAHNHFKGSLPDGYPQDFHYFDEVESGDISILYRDISGDPLTWQNGQAKKTTGGKIQPYSRLCMHPDRRLPDQKYESEKGQPLELFLTPAFFEAWKENSPYNLIVVEGEFKAFCLSMQGVPAIGMQGIWGFVEKATGTSKDLDHRFFHPTLVKILRESNVKSLLFLFDNDFRKIKFDPEKPEKNIAKRPFQFFSAMKAIQGIGAATKSTFPECSGVTILTGWHDEGDKNKGIDDLINAGDKKSLEGLKLISEYFLSEHTLEYDFDKFLMPPNDFSVNEANNIQFFNTEKIKSTDLKKLICIDDVDSFFRLHGNDIGLCEFTFFKETYKYNIDEDKLEKTDEQNPIYFNKGAIFIKEPGKDNKPKHKKLSNFVVTVKYQLTDGERSEYIIKFQGQNGKIVEKVVPADDLSSLDRFRARIFNISTFLLYAKSTEYLLLLEKICNGIIEARRTTKLGYQEESGHYLFANGALDSKGQFHEINEYGITPTKPSYFSPVNPMTAGEPDIFFKRFNFYDDSELSFSDWSRQFMTVFGQESLLSIGFALSCVFSDIIFRKKAFFPLMYLFGQTGTGKTFHAECLTLLFGTKQDEFNLDSQPTISGISRSLTKYSNAMMFLDEYNSDLDRSIIGMIKALWNRSGRPTGQKTVGNETYQESIEAGYAILGETMPLQQQGLFNRCILIEHNKSDFTIEENRQLEILKKMQGESISHFMKYLHPLREVFEKRFEDTYNYIYEEVRSFINEPVNKIEGAYSAEFNKEEYERYKSLSDKIIGSDINPPGRVYQNYSVVLTTLYILSKQGFDFHFTNFSQVILEACNLICEQSKSLQSNEEVSRLLELLDMLIKEQKIMHGVQYKVTDKNLYIKLSEIHSWYQSYYFRIYRKQPLSKRELISYIKQNKSFVDYDACNFQAGRAKAYKFNHEKIKEDLGLNFHGYGGPAIPESEGNDDPEDFKPDDEPKF